MKLLGAFFLAMGILSGCAQGPHFSNHVVGQTKYIVTSAGASVSTVRTVGGIDVSCVRLGPDATSDTGNNLNLGLVGTGAAGDSDFGQEVELIGRTPTNVLVRDLLFQICVARQSGLLNDEKYNKLLESIIHRGLDLSEKETKQIKFDVSVQSAEPAPEATTAEVIPSANAADSSTSTTN